MDKNAQPAAGRSESGYCQTTPDLVAGRCDDRIGDVSAAIEAARDAPRDRFVILERSGQHYMQCLCQDPGWVLEKREGNEAAHFRGLVRAPQPGSVRGQDALMARIFPNPSEPDYYLTFDQVLEAMEGYHLGRPEPRWLEWQRVDVS